MVTHEGAWSLEHALTWLAVVRATCGILPFQQSLTHVVIFKMTNLLCFVIVRHGLRNYTLNLPANQYPYLQTYSQSVTSMILPHILYGAHALMQYFLAHMCGMARGLCSQI